MKSVLKEDRGDFFEKQTACAYRGADFYWISPVVRSRQTPVLLTSESQRGENKQSPTKWYSLNS